MHRASAALACLLLGFATLPAALAAPVPHGPAPADGRGSQGASPSWGSEPPAGAGGEPSGGPPAAERLPSERLPIDQLPPDSVTHGTLSAGGRTIGYTVTAGTLTLRDADGRRTARLFYTAYVAEGGDSPAGRLSKGGGPLHGGRGGGTGRPSGRPVSFFFNGGPGAASAYLQLGAAGPVALEFPDANPADGANARLAPNPDSWLPFTDMVFIDAVGTGYSRPAKADAAARQFYGVKGDADAFADAIRLWIAHNGREASPKYLVGESYGGMRAIKTARALQFEQNIALAGLVLLSPAIEMDLLSAHDNPVTAAMVLPTLAAAALQEKHQLTPQAVQAAYAWAFGPYLTTIAGPLLHGEEATRFYAKIADLTGLPETVVAKQRGVIDPSSHDVLSQDGRLMSSYDATLTIADPAPESDGGADSPEPVLFGFGTAFGNAFTGYVRNQLGFRTDLPYTLLNTDVNKQWDYRENGDVVAQTMPDLRKLLALNPSLRVFVANGYFDLACPFAGSRYLLDRLPVGRDRVRLKVYPGGHMLYLNPDTRAALSHDVAALYATP